MKSIFTVQHTQSEHHINGMIGSWTDWNLTELGKQQAERIARMMKQELDRNRIKNPAALDKLRKKETDEYIAEFKQTLSRCGISVGDYAEMTENVSSRKEADVRKGLQQLAGMAERAQAHGVSRDAFIRGAVKSSEFFWEQDLNEVSDINRVAGMIRLSSADLVSERTIDAAMGRWKAAVKEQGQMQK